MDLLLYILFCIAVLCYCASIGVAVYSEITNQQENYAPIYTVASVMWLIIIAPKAYIVFGMVYSVGLLYALIKLYITVRMDNTVVISVYRVFTWMMISPVLLPIDLFKGLVWLTSKMAIQDSQ